MHIDVSWDSKRVVVDESLPKALWEWKDQWSVTASKQLGPHIISKTKVVQELGPPPIVICRDLEHRVVREVEQDIMFNRQLDEAGMAEAS